MLMRQFGRQAPRNLMRLPLCRPRAALAAALLLAVAPATLTAQGTPDRQRWVFGVGTFLTRDRGWNYGEGLELGAALERDLGSRLQVSAGVTALTSLRGPGDEVAIYPPYPDGLEHAAALRLQARTQPRGAGLYALAGLEALAGDAGNQGRGVRAGASVGLGLSWQRAARSAVEGQYTVFDQPFGTTRGLLSVRFVHRR
jgi:hypothetical protein